MADRHPGRGNLLHVNCGPALMAISRVLLVGRCEGAEPENERVFFARFGLLRRHAE